MANEHTKTLLLWDILVPSPDIFTLMFCTGNSIFFSYEKNTTQETIGSYYDFDILIGQGKKTFFLYLTEAQCEGNP